jgi:electron transfer flavoprotein beta subunit
MEPLSIVVCIKQVPDSWAEKSLRPADHRLDRDAADAVLNELDEYAVEEALRITESRDGETTVTVLSMGPDRTAETLRKALSMGADAAVHLADPAQLGLTGAGTRVLEATPRPARSAGEITDDDGTGGTRLAAFLAAHSFA